MFDTIISVVKNLPHILGEVTKRFKEFVREVFSIAGSTIVEELKLIVNHVRQFLNGVKQDVLKFYHVSQFEECILTNLELVCSEPLFW